MKRKNNKMKTVVMGMAFAEMFALFAGELDMNGDLASSTRTVPCRLGLERLKNNNEG